MPDLNSNQTIAYEFGVRLAEAVAVGAQQHVAEHGQEFKDASAMSFGGCALALLMAAYRNPTWLDQVCRVLLDHGNFDFGGWEDVFPMLIYRSKENALAMPTIAEALERYYAERKEP